MAMKEFQAESKRLLDLMINSIYTHKEIFLRELISNASDAIDKLYYRTLEDGATGLSREDFFIRLDVDKEARTLSITDNGIGMTQEELDNNLASSPAAAPSSSSRRRSRRRMWTSSASSAWGSTPLHGQRPGHRGHQGFWRRRGLALGVRGACRV